MYINDEINVMKYLMYCLHLMFEIKWIKVINIMIIYTMDHLCEIYLTTFAGLVLKRQ